MSLPIQPQQFSRGSAPTAAPRMWSLAGMYVVAAGVGSLAGGGLAEFNTWGQGDAVKAAIIAGVCVLGTSLGILGGLRAIRFGVVPTKSHPNPTVQPTMLAAMSVSRMMLSLVAALGCFLLLKPEGKTFWVAFLLGGLLSLVVETAWSLKWLRAIAATSPDASPSQDGPEVGS